MGLPNNKKASSLTLYGEAVQLEDAISDLARGFRALRGVRVADGNFATLALSLMRLAP